MSDQTVWITGGSSGIGAYLCQDLLRQGYRVVSFARRAAEARQGNADLHSVEVDLTDASATEEAFKEAAARWPATRLVHNAGATRERLLPEVTQQDLRDLSQLHLGCAIAMVQAALPCMREQKFGRIVLMSTRAVVGLEKRTVYSSTKAGMIGLGRTWALELAADGITVNVIAPGAVEDTEMFHDVVPRGSELATRVAERIPVGRVGRPADVARAVHFFLDDAADFVTGQTLFVCGGSSVGNMSFT